VNRGGSAKLHWTAEKSLDGMSDNLVAQLDRCDTAVPYLCEFKTKSEQNDAIS
jgi:hypothetical protein